MSPEQEIQLLKSEIAQLWGMLANMKSPEMPELRGGPAMRNDVQHSARPLDGEVADETTPYRRTLEPNPDSGPRKGVAQIANADTAHTDAENVPLLALDAVGNGNINWAGVDGSNAAYNGHSLEVVGNPRRLQIRNWQEGAQTYSDGTHDGILARKRANNEAELIDPATLTVGYVENYPAHDHNDETAHSGLQSAEQDANGVYHHSPYAPGDVPHDTLYGLGDDDHSQYLLLSGDQSRNAMSGTIGDELARLSLSPYLRYLYDGNQTIAAKWHERELHFDWSVQNGDFHVAGEAKKFRHNSRDGITENIEWDDINGQHHTLAISGGIVVGHTVG